MDRLTEQAASSRPTAKSRRKRVLDVLFVGSLPPDQGGSAVVNHLLLLGLAKAGHRVRALVPGTREVIDSGNGIASSYRGVSVSRFQLPGMARFPVLMHAPKALRRQENEIIACALNASIARRRPEVIVLGTEHFAWHVPDIARAARIPSLALIQGSGNYGLLPDFPCKVREQLLRQLRKCDVVVAVAKHLAAGMRKIGLPEVRWVANPVDCEKFKPTDRDLALLRSLKIREDQFVVVHTSNLKRSKRALDIVRSAERVVRQCDAMYVVVGAGPMRQVMEDECERRRLRARFRFIGWINHDRIPKYLNLASVVLMPSDSEGMALAYLEAQACGRLLIASNIAAAREAIVDGETGMLFRKGDIRDLVAKTLLAAREPKLRERMGREASRRVRAHSLGRFVAKYEELLQRLVVRRSVRNEIKRSPQSPSNALLSRPSDGLSLRR